MKVCAVVVLLIALIVSTKAQNSTVPVPKDNVKPYYSVEAKMDIVKTLAPKILSKKVVDKLIDANLKIVTTRGNSIMVKGFFMDNKVQTSNVERLLKVDNQTFHVAQVKQNIERHTDVLENSFDLLLVNFKNSSTIYDQKLQPIFDRIQDIDGFYRNMIEHFNTYTDKDLAEQIEEVIIGFKYLQPHQKIINLISNDITPDLIHALITKILTTDYCGGKVTKSQSVMLFFDYLMVKVAEGDIFLQRCYEIKEMLVGVDLKKMKQQISTSIESNIRTLYTTMMSHIDNFVIPDIPKDVVNPVKECFIDLVCAFSGATCTVNSLMLIDEWAPILISTKHNGKLNTEITSMTFAATCTLKYIPNSIFLIFPKINTLDASNTKLERLHSDSFFNASSLTTALFYLNQLTKLEARTFIHAPKLVSLSLQNNVIKEIDLAAFEGLSLVTKINLRSNQLSALSTEVFTPLKSIQHLYLSSNVCTNKDFSSIGGSLTTVSTEIDITTKCGEKAAVIRNTREQQTFQKELKDNMIGKIESLERSAQVTIGGLQKKVERMETKFEKMEKKFDSLMVLMQKIVTQSSGMNGNNI